MLIKVLIIIGIILFLIGCYPIRISVAANLQNTVDVKVFWQPLPFLKWRRQIFEFHKDNLFKTMNVSESTEKTSDYFSAENLAYEGVEVDLSTLEIAKNLVANQASAQRAEEVETLANPQNKLSDETKAKFEKNLKAAEKQAKKAEKAEKKQEANQENSVNSRQTKKEKIKATINNFWTIKADVQKLIYRVLAYLRIEQLNLKGNLPGDPILCGYGCGLLWSIFGFGFGYLSSKVKKFPEAATIDLTMANFAPWEGDFKGQFMLRLGNLLVLGVYIFLFIRRNKLFPGQNKKVAKQEKQGKKQVSVAS